MVSEIALFTPDVGRMVEFYEQLLGQAPTSRWPGGATFDLDGTTLLIHVAVPEGVGVPPNQDHFAFRVSDLDGVAAGLGAEARDYPWGRSAYVRDPDGRLVELN